MTETPEFKAQRRANRDGLWAGLVVGVLVGLFCAGEVVDGLALVWQSVLFLLGWRSP